MFKKICAGVLAAVVVFGAVGTSGSANGGKDAVVTASAADLAGVVIDEANFPDENFRQFVSENFDTDCDGYLSEDEIAAVTEIHCSIEDIADLTGIELFQNLEILKCSNNNLTFLDVSKNSALVELVCFNNQLTELDVSKNTLLSHLDCGSNQLASLDVSGCKMLAELHCGYNPLTSLDVSKNTALVELFCYKNQLTSLDVSGCTALEFLSCVENPLISLDVSGCKMLAELYCNSNNLTELDISENTALVTLWCYDNQLTSLDVSDCTVVEVLHCYNNQLTSLDVSGCKMLAELYCGDNQLTSLDVSENTALAELTCYSNQLASLDVRKNTALVKLFCYSNQLTSLDVSENAALVSLSCYSNQLTSLDVSENTALDVLDCSYNQIVELDISSCSKITKAYLNGDKRKYEDNTSYDYYEGSDWFHLGVDNNVNIITTSSEPDDTKSDDTILTDDKTSITVKAGAGVLPKGTKLSVTPKPETQTDTSISFDVILIDANGKAVQPNGEVTVSIPVPEGWSADKLYVYRAEADGSYTDMKAVFADGYATFTTDHFSTYILSTVAMTASPTPETPNPETPNTETPGGSNPDTGASLAMIPAVIALGAGVGASRKKK